MAKLEWRRVAEAGSGIRGSRREDGLRDSHGTWRAKVPGGWLVSVWMIDGGGVAFMPDPEHAWAVEELKDPNAS